MSSKKILTAAEIRAELAYRRIQATNLAAELGISYGSSSIMVGRKNLRGTRHGF